jgi:hypothetical protein
LALGNALDRTERLRDGLATFKEAAALALEVGSPVDLARAALGVEEVEVYTGDERASVELLEAALRALGSDETVLSCRVLSQLARALLDRGEIERANELSRAATDTARRLGDCRALYDALISERAARTGYSYSASEFSDIRRALSELLAAADEIGDPTIAAIPPKTAMIRRSAASASGNCSRACKNRIAGCNSSLSTSASAIGSKISLPKYSV